MNKRPELDIVNPPGQIDNSKELDKMVYKKGTLGEYIDKTLKHEAMLDRQWNKKKLTFDEWLKTVFFQAPTPEAYDLAKDAWKAAQENV